MEGLEGVNEVLYLLGYNVYPTPFTSYALEHSVNSLTHADIAEQAEAGPLMPAPHLLLCILLRPADSSNLVVMRQCTTDEGAAHMACRAKDLRIVLMSDGGVADMRRRARRCLPPILPALADSARLGGRMSLAI